MDGRKLMAALAALALMTGTGCGQVDEGGESSAASSELSAVSVTGDTSESESSEESSSAKDAEKSKDSVSVKTTAAAKDEKKSAETTAAAKTAAKSGGSGSSSSSGSKSSDSGTSSGGESSSGSSSEGGSSSSGDNTSGSGSSSNSSSSSGNSSPGGNSSSGGSSSGNFSEPEGSSEEKIYTAEITLGSNPSVTGDNVTVSGSTVAVSAGGSYRFTGSVQDGQIYVSTATEEKVKIVLDGVDIACSTGPAIFINEAKKCIVELADGSANFLSDGAKDKVNDGVIFSNDTLRIKGGGRLEINSNNAHGIASDDDVIIEGGTFLINSVKSGIFAHDDITVSGGDLTVFGGTNGLKSKGTINFTGGTAKVSGGSKEEKSSVYAAGAFNYSGGYLYAAGNSVTAPTNSANPYIVAQYSGSGGDSVALILDGVQQAVIEPHNNYRCVLMLSPDIREGSSFYANINGADTAENTVSGTQNVFALS